MLPRTSLELPYGPATFFFVFVTFPTLAYRALEPLAIERWTRSHLERLHPESDPYRSSLLRETAIREVPASVRNAALSTFYLCLLGVPGLIGLSMKILGAGTALLLLPGIIWAWKVVRSAIALLAREEGAAESARVSARFANVLNIGQVFVFPFGFCTGHLSIAALRETDPLLVFIAMIGQLVLWISLSLFNASQLLEAADEVAVYGRSSEVPSVELAHVNA